MAEQTQCIRCNRLIDAHARICPYCNWDQVDTAVPPPQAQPVAANYVPPEERDWRRYLMIGIGGFVLLIASFALGSLIHGHNPPKDAEAKSPLASDAKSAPVKPGPISDVTFVPVNETAGIEQPITSAPAANPAEGVPNEYQRSDATAVSSAEYAQLAARANAERKAQIPVVDPRSLGGPAYAQGQPPRPPQRAREESRETPQGQIAVRTRPQPLSQPIADISVDRTTTIRLDLTIGRDGRVKEVQMHGGIPGQTAKIISSVQRWTFKPATMNGEPVESPYSVEISFKGNE